MIGAVRLLYSKGQGNGHITMVFRTIRKTFHYICRDERGMTLLDIAVAMMVLGLLMAPLIQAYNIKKLDDARGFTVSNSAAIYKAISDFYFEEGRYPCPAVITLGPNDAAYGQEDCTNTVAADGALSDGTPAGTLAGGVPFKALKVPVEITLDGWAKNKFTYVVTRDLAMPPAFPIDAGNGAITVQEVPELNVDECSANPPQTLPAGESVHLMLISHGRSGIGAFNANGIQVQACPTGGGVPLDSTNCNYDDDATFLFHTCVTDLKEGVNFYDDQISRYSSLPQRIWAVNSVDTNDIFADRGNVNEIGINTQDPQEALHVVGNIRVDGNADANEICNANGGECMEPELIAGDDPAMQCENSDASTIASGIGGNEVRCNVTFRPDYAGEECADGKYVIGLAPGGGVICSP
jgi:hypothetical protein